MYTLLSINTVGNMLAEKIQMIPIPKNEIIDSNNVLLSSGIFLQHGGNIHLQDKAIVNVLCDKLKLADEPVMTGNAYFLCSLNGQMIFYCNEPDQSFYLRNQAGTSVILGSNKASPPQGWSGNAILLSSLLTVSNNEITIVQPFLRKALCISEPIPPKRNIRPRTPAFFRRIFYLKFFLTLIDHYSDLQYQNKGLCDNDITQIKKSDISAFISHEQGSSLCAKTVDRDFKFYHENNNDNVCAMINLLWKKFGDAKFITNPNLRETIEGFIKKLSKNQYSEFYYRDNNKETAVEWTREGRRNTVLVSQHGIDAEKNFKDF